MSGTSTVVMRNLIFGVFGETVSGALNFITLILIARSLGTSEFGNFSYILAFVGIFQLLADMGLTNTLVREIARERDRVLEIVGALRPLAWISSIIIFLIIALLGWPLSATTEIYQATLLLGLAVLATFHSFSYASVCRAFEEMGYNATGNVAHKLLQIGLVIIALQLDSGIVGIAVAMLVANVFQWLFFRTVVRQRYVRGLRWRYDISYWRYLLVEAIQVGFAMVFRRANQQVGTLMLAAMSSSTSVGLLSAAYKIIQMIDMIPFTLSLPFFPHISRLAREAPEQLFQLLEKVWRLFMIIAAPITIWLYVMSPRLIELMFGASYSNATSTLRVLTFTVLLLFLTALYAYIFLAIQRQRFYTISSALCLAANIIAGIILIPLYHHLGAAMAALAGEIIFCLSGAWMLYTLGLRLNIMRVVVAPIAIALVVAPILYLALHTSLLIAVMYSLVYTLLYLVIVVVSGTLRKDERNFIVSFFIKRNTAETRP